MKAYFLITSSGPLVILTTYKRLRDPKLIDKFTAQGVTKFIAYEVPLAVVRRKYGKHFDVVCDDLRESDDLRVLDYSGERAFKNFRFKELVDPIYYETVPKKDTTTQSNIRQ